MHQGEKSSTEEMISIEEYLYKKGILKGNEKIAERKDERKTRAAFRFNVALEMAEMTYL